MVGAGSVEDQEGSSSSSQAAAAAAAALIARAGRPPRPASFKSIGLRHPFKHRRFRARVAKILANASCSAQVLARARELGEAIVAAVALAVPKESERPDETGYISGEWKSEDGSLLCGYSSFRGCRERMEDLYDIKSSKIDANQINLFGVFDGHGGSHVAEYLKQHLFGNLLKHPAFITDTKSAVSETYKKTDLDFLDAETNINRQDGSTASTAIFVGNHLYVANVGDSRAVISKSGKAIVLSDDHKPNRSDERERIENAGGVVTGNGTWRVGGVLAMSRAFGDRLLKQFVVAEPEIQHAAAFVKEEKGPEAAARKLAEIAFARGSTDNITCIVVEFHSDKTSSCSPPSSGQS